MLVKTPKVYRHDDKLRKLLFALETASGLDQLSRFPGWKLHRLKGSLDGFWSLPLREIGG